MISIIFQPEITDLESQIAQLQAQITAATSRIDELSKAEFITSGAMKAMQYAVDKVSTLAPSRISNLKAAVLNLFNGDDDNNDDDQPSAPTPNAPTGGIEAQPLDGIRIVSVTHEPSPAQCELASWLTCDVLSGQNSDLIDRWWHELIHQKLTRAELTCTLEDAPPESLKGQSVELVCLLEDAPESALKGQAVEIACDRDDKSQRFIELVSVSDAIAYQRKYDGEIVCVYAGFNNKARATLWGEWLASKHKEATSFKVRPAERLTTYKHELKLWGMSIEQIERLAGSDLTKSPPSNFGDAPLRNHYVPAPPAKPPAASIKDLEPGDIVRSIACPEWMYRVVEIRASGILDCERLGVPEPYRLGIKVGQVSLVSKKVSSEEAIASIEPPVEQQLAYNPYPSGRRGAVANWTAIQKSGGLKATTKYDPMEKWRRIEAEQKAIAAQSNAEDDDF